jgi:hypothetical protein
MKISGDLALGLMAAVDKLLEAKARHEDLRGALAGAIRTGRPYLPLQIETGRWELAVSLAIGELGSARELLLAAEGLEAPPVVDARPKAAGATP